MDPLPASDPSSTKTVRFAEFTSSLTATGSLLEWFSVQQPAGFDPLVWVQAQTALVEGFTNAVRHAHGPIANPPPVRVEIITASDVLGQRLRLVIHDRGLPFDLQAAMAALEHPTDKGPNLDPLADPSSFPEREAHWGLVMLARLRDSYGWQICYESAADGGNQLVLQSPPG